MSNRRQAIIWTNADTIDWRINAALGGDESNQNSYSVSQMSPKAVTENIVDNKPILVEVIAWLWLSDESFS